MLQTELRHQSKQNLTLADRVDDKEAPSLTFLRFVELNT